MAPDELAHGPDEPTPRLPGGWLLGVALVVLAGVLIVTRAGSSGVPDAPAPSASGHPSSADDRIETSANSAPLDFVRVDSVCAVRVQARHRFTVTFLLTNSAAAPVLISSVRPSLPLGGLRPRGTIVGGHLCGQYRLDPPPYELLPASQLRVTFRFLVPHACPAPYPVRVALRSADGVPAGGAVVTVLADLGRNGFATCQSPMPTAEVRG